MGTAGAGGMAGVYSVAAATPSPPDETTWQKHPPTVSPVLTMDQQETIGEAQLYDQ